MGHCHFHICIMITIKQNLASRLLNRQALGSVQSRIVLFGSLIWPRMILVLYVDFLDWQYTVCLIKNAPYICQKLNLPATQPQSNLNPYNIEGTYNIEGSATQVHRA